MINSYRKLLLSMFMLISSMAYTNANDCCNIYPLLTDEAIQTIKIINDTECSLHVNLSIPEQTQADITLKQFKSPQTLLHEGIISDSPEKIKQALFIGADINNGKDSKSPLLWAILLGRHNAVETLLRLGANPDDICVSQVMKIKDIKSLLLFVKYRTPNLDMKEVVRIIYHAVQDKESIDLIRTLVNHRYNINELWAPVILLTFFKPSEGEEMVRFLINRGADPNHCSGNGSVIPGTPLYMAAALFCNVCIVKILIEAGANIRSSTGPQGYSLLSCVVERDGLDTKKKEVIAFLLEQGASL